MRSRRARGSLPGGVGSLPGGVGCTFGEEQKEEAHDGGLHYNQIQAPLPPNLLQEKEAAHPGWHLHDAKDQMSEEDVHPKRFHLELQCKIGITDSKPGTKSGEGKGERGEEEDGGGREAEKEEEEGEKEEEEEGGEKGGREEEEEKGEGGRIGGREEEEEEEGRRRNKRKGRRRERGGRRGGRRKKRKGREEEEEKEDEKR